MTDQVTETPSALLREAARIMRELAEAATPGPWIGHRIGLMGGRIGVVVAQPPPHGAFVMVDRDNEARIEDAKHIASWHPAVALAVADWLDEVVALIEFGSELNRAGEVGAALDVARVYLGRTDE